MVSLSHGKRQGIATILGLMSGCVVHTLLIAFGVSILIKQNNLLFQILKIAGAIYLFYLAFQVFRSDSNITFQTPDNKKSILEYYKKGVWMNLLNPKVSLFFLAFFPGFLFSKQLSETFQFLILGGVFIIVSFIVFLSIAFMANYISSKLRQSQKIVMFFKWLQILVFTGIGIFILFSKK
ncbi:LysE family translocator [Aquimarina sp. ERC-38]|uniref:LysE family translocator n=1 Tax=Aquimarina sp. ERC-38 TaxID=2949996 RepID=UPI002AF6A210|nr:LysE family translocator [Aquimarina sp. ERC-38]